jgi:RNA polymerase sigma factor (sigma-70 family)
MPHAKRNTDGQHARDARRDRATRRTDVIVRHLSLVRQVAGAVRRSIGRVNISTEDLTQDGMIGLIFAAENFDPTHGTAFRSYARRCIFGKMMRGLRKYNGIPVLVAKRVRRFAAAWEACIQEHGRPPTDEELLARLGGDDADLVLMDGARVPQTDPLSAVVAGRYAGGKPSDFFQVLADESATRPDDEAIRLEIRRALFRGLSGRERRIVVGYFIDGWSMAELGRMVGMTESGVFVNVAHTLARLRTDPTLRRMAGVPADAVVEAIKPAHVRRIMFHEPTAPHWMTRWTKFRGGAKGQSNPQEKVSA